MKRRAFLSTSAAATAAGLGSFANRSSAQENIQWKMVTSWPRNTPGVGVNAQRLADRIGELSNGRLTIKLHAAGELVPPFEVLDAVQRGTAEMGHTALYYGVGKSPALHFFTTVPFGLSMTELQAWLRFGDGQTLKDEVLTTLGLQAFYVGNSGTQAMGWFRKEINTLEDIQGLKMRIAGLGGAAMAKLGATPVLVPPGEIFTAMQSGTVDAAEWVGPWNDIAFGLQNTAEYYYLPAFHEPGAALDAVVNPEAYAALPTDLQAIVRAACDATALDTGSDFLFHNIQSFAGFGQYDVQLRTLPEDVVMALGEATRVVVDELMAGDELTRRVGESYRAFADQASRYASAMEGTMLAQRARVRG